MATMSLLERWLVNSPFRAWLQRGLYRVLPHAVESMFDEAEWRSALAAANLRLDGSLRQLPLWDMCGVATKAPEA